MIERDAVDTASGIIGTCLRCRGNGGEVCCGYTTAGCVGGCKTDQHTYESIRAIGRVKVVHAKGCGCATGPWLSCPPDARRCDCWRAGC